MQNYGAKVTRGVFQQSFNFTLLVVWGKRWTRSLGLSKVRCRLLYFVPKLVESGSGYSLCWFWIESGSGSWPWCSKKNVQIFTFENKCEEKTPFMCFLTPLKITFMFLENPDQIRIPDPDQGFRRKICKNLYLKTNVEKKRHLCVFLQPLKITLMLLEKPLAPGQFKFLLFCLWD